jgi:hypothetical protein
VVVSQTITTIGMYRHDAPTQTRTDANNRGSSRLLLDSQAVATLKRLPVPRLRTEREAENSIVLVVLEVRYNISGLSALRGDHLFEVYKARAGPGLPRFLSDGSRPEFRTCLPCHIRLP